jgi:hypothetical protein
LYQSKPNFIGYQLGFFFAHLGNRLEDLVLLLPGLRPFVLELFAVVCLEPLEVALQLLDLLLIVLHLVQQIGLLIDLTTTHIYK